MFFRRIKAHLWKCKKSYFLTFEITHFLIDVVLAVLAIHALWTPGHFTQFRASLF